MNHSPCQAIALTGVVPAACDAEAGEAHAPLTSRRPPHSQAFSSLRWFQQEVPALIGHDDATLSTSTKPEEMQT
jgi:hypothetical protein